MLFSGDMKIEKLYIIKFHAKYMYTLPHTIIMYLHKKNGDTKISPFFDYQKSYSSFFSS